jgi:Tol biopolymer transport system component/tRNA A-37 threonylcarbamoyl transferase component Bud32
MTDIARLQAALDARYTVERELGAGGMATVYLANDTKHHRKIAVKVLRPELAASLGAERFHREIEVAAQLQHPHILPLLDSGMSDGVLFYMMPFVDGESLRDRLSSRGELPVHEAVRILVEITDALAHAHARGVVHRDIKPDNILLSGRHALVMDFGVAKAVSEATGRQKLTTAGIALGTPNYMAPEQATADPQIDHRVDIYAVGCLAYELLTGHPPFAGHTPAETLAAQVTVSPTPPRNHRPNISQGLNDVVMRCLEKRPADRWQDAEQLLAQLEQQLTPSTGMTPAAAAPFAAAARGRNPWVIGGTAAAVIVAVVAAALNFGGSSPAAPISLGRTTQLTFEQGLEIEPAISPDGKTVAYAAGALGQMRIYVRVPGGRAVPVTTDAGSSQRGPVWSPDGTRLLFRQDGDLMLAPAIGGVARVLVSAAEHGAVRGAAWAPDSQRVVYVTGGTVATDRPTNLYIKRLDGSTPDRVVAVVDDAHAPAWSPDGKWIVIASGNSVFSLNDVASFGNMATSALFIVPADSGTGSDLVGHQSLNVSPVWLTNDELLFVSDRDGQRDVYSLKVRRGAAAGPPVRVTSGSGAQSVSVAGGGQRIVYGSFAQKSNVYSLPLGGSRALETSDARQVTTGNQTIESMSVSSDGRHLYFDSDRAGNSDIYRMPLTGGELEQLTNDPGPDFAPSESPDGKWIAFHGIRRGTRDIFVMPRSGGEARAATSYPGQERYPQWSPSASRLAYHSGGRSVNVIARRPDGTWGDSLYVADALTPAAWVDDSTLVLSTVAGLQMITTSGRPVGTLKTPNAVPQGIRTAANGVIVYKSFGSGVAEFWSAPNRAQPLRLVARLDDPLRPASRVEFATDGKMIYFTIYDRQSDVFIADLARR